ncbi:hypothetical protein KAF25_001908 [Fusarium avenaceum]|uniref:Nucleoside phosphorylase domain-containing protein n=1 Tax=Fusarium avenaceum TaxID=40199 RepID=A0A9P7GXE6_9HYPO|nr:hypothetical protein KAF25_001908 [Fusarium avenaceum]
MSDEPCLENYTIGWICALQEEYEAACRMLDDEFEGPETSDINDNNAYVFGCIGEHNVVIGCLPVGRCGISSAAVVARDMVRSFTRLRFALLVGIGGGAPTPERDIRLGDVVVSVPQGKLGGVIQYDFGKRLSNGRFQQISQLNSPPEVLLGAIRKIWRLQNDPKKPDRVSEHIKLMDDMPEYQRPAEDRLYRADYEHKGGVTCTSCATNGLEERLLRKTKRAVTVHHGIIASANSVMKNAEERNQYAQDPELNVLCFEMEAAGLMNNFPCLVIRGICDYSDSHKNNDWHRYAAITAAAYSRELLHILKPQNVTAQPPWAGKFEDILTGLEEKVNRLSDGIENMQFRQLNQEYQAILDWFTPVDYGTHQSVNFKIRQQGTGQWFLESAEYREWLDADGNTLFCLGIPGAGKTVLSSIVINNLQTRFSDNPKIGVAYIYCNFQRTNEQGIDDILASVLRQLTQCLSSLPDSIKSLYKQHNTKRTRPSRDEILGLLQSVLPIYSRVFLVVDALDECQASVECRRRFVSELFNLQMKFGINIFATSKHIPEIISLFKANLSKEIEIRASPEDVARYLEGRMKELSSCVQQNRQLQEDITTGISETVDGMFLLAKFYLNELIGELSPNDIRSAIEAFRKQSQGSGEDQRIQALGRAYEQIMERINEQMPGMRTLAMKALLWITWAKRQLTVSELQHALATKTGKSEFDHGDLIPIEDIVSVCAGLVTVDEDSGIIRLVHYTTQQYLERSWDSWFRHSMFEITTGSNLASTGPMTMTVQGRDQTAGLIDYTKREYLEWTQGSWSPNANAAIATACLTYLLFTDFNVEFSNLDEYLHPGKYGETPYPLLNYCVEYSAQHARLATPEPPFVTHFFSSESNIIKNWLLLAARNGGPHAEATTEWLVERGACIDIKDSEWKTPLHHAVLNDWKRCVLLLLQRQASLDPDSDNMTPFHYTVKNSNQEVAQIFLDADTPVDLTVRRRCIAKMFQNGRTTCRVQDSAQNPTPKGSVKVGLTSLHLATLTGCREMTKFLLEQGANPNYASDYGETPLHLALKRELSGPRCLANPDFWKDLDNRIECIFSYLEEEEESLSARLRVDEVRLEIIDLLLKHPGIDLNAQDTAGVSPLHIVSGGGSASNFLIQKLLGKGARVSMRTNKGRTPLHVACRAGSIDKLTILLESGADPTECDEEGANALHYAAQHRHGEAIRTILSHMPQGTREAFTNSKDKHGKNALHHLCKNFKWIGGVDSLKSLLELSTGVNELDQAGMSPTAILLKSGAFLQSDKDPEALRLLFGHGADPTFETKQGLNLVHLAVKSGRASDALLRILANQKIDMRAMDKRGRTAFHHGAISGNLTKEALYCLRDEFQLSTELLDEQGKTPLAYAVEKDQEYHHPNMFNPNRWARIRTLLRE